MTGGFSFWIRSGRGLHTIHKMQPIASYDFPAYVVHVDVIPDHDAQLLYTRECYWAIDVWSLVVHYWPEALQVLAAMVLFVSILKYARVLRRKRRAGSAYCRKCNYCLDGVDADSCPECAAVLPAKMMQARSRTHQIAIPICMMLIAIVFIALPHIVKLPRSGTVNNWIDWASRPLLDVATKRQWTAVLEHPRHVNRFRSMEARTLAIQRTITHSWGTPLDVVAVIPNGNQLVVADYTGRFESIALNSDGKSFRIRSVPELKSQFFEQSLVGFPEGNEEVFFASLNTEKDQTIVSSINYVTGESRIVLATGVDKSQQSANIEIRSLPRQIILVNRAEGSPVLLDAHHKYWDHTTPGLLVRPLEDPTTTIGDSSLPSWSGTEIRSVGRSSAVLLRYQGASALKLVDWRDGAVLWSYGTRSRESMYSFPGELGVSSTGKFSWEAFHPYANEREIRMMHVNDMATGDTLMSIELPFGFFYDPRGAFTSGDKFLCVHASNPMRGPIGLCVFDLATLHADPEQ